MRTRLVPGITVLALLGSLLLAACAPAAPPPAPTPTAAVAAAATPTSKPAPTAAPPTPTPKPEKIVIAFPTTGFTDLPIVVALKKGFFREEGLEPETMVIASDVAIKAMVAGELDYVTSWGSAVRAAVQGVPVKAIIAELDKTPHILVTRRETKSVADLRGKKIGVASIGGTVDVLARIALKKAGVDPDKEVTMVAIPNSATRLVSVRTGVIDGSVIDPAFAIAAEKEGLSLLVRFKDVVDIAMSGLVTTDKKIKENPDQVLRAARATLKGLKYLRDPKNRAEMVKLMSEEFKLAQEVAEKTYDLSIETVSEDGIAREEAVQTDIDLSRERVGKKEQVPLSQVIDYSFVRKLKEGR